MQITSFYRTVVGKKVVMAVTGAVLVAFVIGHLSGNLLMFRGPEAMNDYATFLHHQMGLLWGTRMVLLTCVVLHITAATQLTLAAKASRPVGYARRVPQVSTWASRLIRWGGALLLVFIVVHLLHFTTGTLHPEYSEHDVYRNVVVGFTVWWVTLFYLVAMAALGLHLYHGIWAALRTLGLALPTRHPLRRRATAALAVAVWVGFSAIPLAVLTGVIGK